MTADLASRYQIVDGKGFSLADIDPGETAADLDKASARPLLENGLKELIGLQERLYASIAGLS